MAVHDLLSKLDKLNNQNLVHVLVPSVARVVKFKQLSVKQQKDLIKTGLDGVISGLTVNNVLNQICKDNSTEDIAFNVIDRVVVSVSLRVNAFGVRHKQDEKDIDLSSIVERTVTLPAVLSATNEYGEELKVSIVLPDLSRDSEVNEHIIKSIKANQNADVGDAVGSIYLYEMVKFVESISMGGEVVMLNTLKPHERAQILETLPANIIKDVVLFMQQFRELETAYLAAGDGVVSIDAGFFAQ